MDRTFIEGYHKIIDIWGYWPSFHDDIINRIEITGSEIILFIDVLNASGSTKVRFIFSEVSSYFLEGEIYGCVSIILDLEFEANNNTIVTDISSSLGSVGTIKSKKVKVEVG